MALAFKQSLASKAVAGRRSVAARAVSRPTWYPGATPPSHLDGTLLGDYGFDPLRLGTQPETLKWYREGELTNGRWAMAAVAGILFTDLVGLPKFWEAGAQTYALDNKTLLAIEVPVMALLESKRYEGYKKTGETGVLGSFPFDPMGMRSEEKKLKELKNGRLAMLAFIGFCSQAAVRGLGPIDCLKQHIADPWNNNIFTSSVGKETTVAVALLCVWPIIIEATKSLNKGQKESVPLFPGTPSSGRTKQQLAVSSAVASSRQQLSRPRATCVCLVFEAPQACARGQFFCVCLSAQGVPPCVKCASENVLHPGAISIQIPCKATGGGGNDPPRHTCPMSMIQRHWVCLRARERKH